MINPRRIGEFVEQTDIRNKDLRVNLLLGVGIEKQFIESHANTVGTDFSTYKIVKKGEFAYCPVTSRNGDKISIAMLTDYNECLISSSYIPFKIKNTNELLPEFLLMIFKSEEFDRYSRFNSWGSAREVFSWEDFCETLISVPSLKEQEKRVKQFLMIEKRQKTIISLIREVEKQAILRIDYLSSLDNAKDCQFCDLVELLKDGSHNPPARIAKGIPLIAGQTLENGFINYEKMTYISKTDYEQIHKYYQPKQGDLILSKIGTVGKVAILRDKDIPIAIHCNSALIRFKEDLFPSSTAFWFLKSESFQLKLKESMTSSVQDFLSLSQIAELSIKLPVISERDSIYFDKCLRLLSNYVDEIEIEKRLHRSMLEVVF